MRRFTETFVIQSEKSDLDINYPYFGPEVDSDGDEHVNNVSICHNVAGEVPPITIDEVIEIMMEFKAKGANKVYIETHADHQGYIFSGVKLTENMKND